MKPSDVRLVRQLKADGFDFVQCCMCLRWGPYEDTHPYADEVCGIKLVVLTIRICMSCKDLMTVFAGSVGFLPRGEA